MHQGGDCWVSSPIKSYGKIKSGKEDAFLEEILTKVSAPYLTMRPSKAEMRQTLLRTVPEIIKKEPVLISDSQVALT
jgi:hypothetical protein